MKNIIPFNYQSLTDADLKYFYKTLKSNHISGNGIYTKKVEKLLENQLGIKKVLLTSSCTTALDISSILIDINEGDEIIIPSFTFVSTALSFYMRGAKIIFADIRKDNLNIDERKLEKLISKKTRAIVIVHYGGISCDIDYIKKIADSYNITLIEDNAHGIFGKYKTKYLGSYGALSTLSFHETKNFTCGEGGALCINDEKLIERAQIIREKGTNRSLFIDGKVDKYNWIDKGSNFLLSELQASILFSQLQSRKTIQLKRMKVWNYYYQGIKTWAYEKGVQLPVFSKENTNAYHTFYLILKNEKIRDHFIKFLNKNNIRSVFHYQPLNNSPMVNNNQDSPQRCPNSESLSGRIVRLPLFNKIKKSEYQKVVKSVIKYD